jgi:hypothetical protein
VWAGALPPSSEGRRWTSRHRDGAPLQSDLRSSVPAGADFKLLGVKAVAAARLKAAASSVNLNCLGRDRRPLARFGHSGTPAIR